MAEALALYALVTALDVPAAWAWPDPRRGPRRLTHALTEPVQRPIRRLLGRPGGWDLAPLAVLALLAATRWAWLAWAGGLASMHTPYLR